jgi:hypothetical protein
MKWYGYVIVALLLILLAASWALVDTHRQLELAGAASNARFKEAKAIVSEYTRRDMIKDSVLRRMQQALIDNGDSAAREKKSWEIERKRYQHQLKAVNTRFATAPELDSVQLAIYGPAETDTIHAISLDYSRKLTGDALRLPIEERYRLRAEEKYDSATGHYTRLIGSFKIDLETLQQDRRADLEAVDQLMATITDQQETIRNQEKIFRRQRRKERIVSGLVIAGIIALAL